MINQTIETAFRVLIFLGSQDANHLVSLQDIHDVVGGSATYLAKITAVLSRSGLLSSQRGAQGGLQLGRDAKKISMLEVVEAAQGKFRPFGQAKVKGGKGKWGNYQLIADGLNDLLVKELSKTTLADLVGTKVKSKKK